MKVTAFYRNVRYIYPSWPCRVSAEYPFVFSRFDILTCIRFCIILLEPCIVSLHWNLFTFFIRTSDYLSAYLPVCLSFRLFVAFIFTARKRSLGQGNVFTPVCHSVNGRGVYPNMQWAGVYPRIQCGRGVCDQGVTRGYTPPPPVRSTSGRYASYWNTFLFWKIVGKY